MSKTSPSEEPHMCVQYEKYGRNANGETLGGVVSGVKVSVLTPIVICTVDCPENDCSYKS